MNVTKLNRSMSEPEFDRKIQDLIETWKVNYNQPESEKENLLFWINSIKNEFIQTMQKIEFEEKFSLIITIRYFELKCHWNLLLSNTDTPAEQSNESDHFAICQISLIQLLLETIEEHIDSNDLIGIKEFIATPVADLTKLNIKAPKEPSKIDMMEAQMQSLHSDKEYLEKELGISDPRDIILLVTNLQSQLSSLKSEQENMVIINKNEISLHGPKKIRISKQGNKK